MFQLKTPNLLLRDFIEDDWQAAHQFCADPQVTHHIDYIATQTEAESQAWVAGCIRHNGLMLRVSYNLAIVQQADEQLVGWIGIGQSSAQTHGDHDFGYALNPGYWGKGYGTEALIGLLTIGFNHLDAQTIFGECDEENPASARVMEKAGMHFKCHYDDYDEGTSESGNMRVYTLDRAEWEG